MGYFPLFKAPLSYRYFTKLVGKKVNNNNTFNHFTSHSLFK